jgi:2-methylcitrate dehydratase PrpD
MTKDGIAWGAFAGACAALLAEKGFTGNPSLLEDPPNRDLMADLGHNWRLLDLYFKPYACCRWAQPAVDGVLRLRRAHGLSHVDVARIVVHTFREAAELSVAPPASTEEAQYHLAWPIAAALVHGEVGPDQVLEEALEDPNVKRLLPLVEARVEDAIQARFPAEALARVEIQTHGGKRLTGDLIPARGDPSSPLSDRELEEKFLRLVEPVYGQQACAILDAVSGLCEVGGAAQLVQAVTVAARMG